MGYLDIIGSSPISLYVPYSIRISETWRIMKHLDVYDDFKDNVTKLLVDLNIEELAETPAHIVADYLVDCLINYSTTMVKRNNIEEARKDSDGQPYAQE